MFKFLIKLFILCIFLFNIKISYATTLTFQQGDGGLYSTVQDTEFSTIYGGNPTSGRMRIGEVDGVSRTLIFFKDFLGSNSGQVSYGVNIISATISLKETNSNYYNQPPDTLMEVYQILEDWEYTTTTGYYSTPGPTFRKSGNIQWTNYNIDPPVSSSSTLSGSVNITKSLDTTFTVDITNDMKKYVAQFTTYKGHIFRASDESIQDNGKSFYSSDTTTVSNRPILTVTYTDINTSDTTPPVLSSGSPSGTLPAHTTSTVLSLVTDENSTCKYDLSPSISYADMSNAFTTTWGTNHSISISGLENNTSYTYYVKCMDYNTNKNTSDYAISFSVDADTVAPAQITDLNIDKCDTHSCALSWTAVGNDGHTGTAYKYDLRYSTSPINTSNWLSSTQLGGEPTPSVNGTKEVATINGLNPNTTYYFAIKALDFDLNDSGISNVPSAKLKAITLSSDIEIKTISSSKKIRPFEDFEGGDSIEYKMAKNEWGVAHFVIITNEEKLENVDVNISLPTGFKTIIFKEDNMNIITPSSIDGDTGEYPDIMFPKIDSYYGETRNTFPMTLSNISRAYPMMNELPHSSYGTWKDGKWFSNITPPSGYTYPYNGTQTADGKTSNYNTGTTGGVITGGIYRGDIYRRYIIIIESDGALGTATFKWSDDNGATFQTGVPTSSSPIELSNGVTISFTGDTASTDFKADDEWLFYASPHRNQPIWIDIYTPDTQTAGTYNGNITISANGKNTKTIPITLQVWDFSIPDTSSLKNTYGLATWSFSDGHPNLNYMSFINNIYVAAGLNHKITIDKGNMDSTGGGGYCQCDSYNEATEDITISCPSFDTYVVPYITNTGESNVILPTNSPVKYRGALTTFGYAFNRFPYNSSFPGGVDPANYPNCPFTDGVKLRKNLRKAAMQHFSNLGIASKYFVYLKDEPSHNQETFDDIISNAQGFRNADPSIQLLVTTTLCAAKEFGAENSIDLMTPNVAFSEIPDTPEYAELANNQCYTDSQNYRDWLSGSNTREIWTYHACIESGSCSNVGGTYYQGWANYAIDTNGVSPRMRVWWARYGNFSGELYYSVNYNFFRAVSPYNIDPYESAYWFGVNGDGSLFYPGYPDKIGGTHDIPIESLRLKLIRLSYQDYEYFKILDDMGLDDYVKKQISKVIFNVKSISKSPSKIDKIRERLANKILGINKKPINLKSFGKGTIR